MFLKARYLLVACSLIVLVTAAPLEKDSDAKILNNEYTIDEKGNYKFSFKTSNGITREETGSLVNEGQPDEHIFVSGRYTYFNTEGQEEIIEYTAGENGYNISPPKLVEIALSPNVVATLLGK